jgi:methylenetetrahydrofolate dehydrogenase (NADP+)/methenyltetrahydrofolate cyclohydrolase
MSKTKIPIKKIINGKSIANTIIKTEKQTIDNYLKTGFRAPCLSTILIGTNYASKIYLNNKIRIAQKIGILIKSYNLTYKTTEKQLLKIINQCNKNSIIDGILVQLPLPKHINNKNIITSIDPHKDVDGFHPENIGLLIYKQPRFIPCTANGVIYLIKSLGISLIGKNVVIIGRSIIAGQAIAQLLLNANATVTICHSYTQQLMKITNNADIVIIAIGKAMFLNKHHIKNNAIVIDVGINRLKNDIIVGDVHSFDIANKVKALTTVPGGVGPMTIAMLLKNTILAYEYALKLI